MDSIRLPLDKVIAFHPILAKVLGGVESAIYWQQLYYWSDKGARNDGYVWKTQNEIKEETTLSREKQDLIRKRMVAQGFIEVKKLKANGVPTLHYKVLVSNVQKAIEECVNNTNGNVGSTQMEACDSHKSLTEITTEITNNISKDIGETPTEKENLDLKDNSDTSELSSLKGVPVLEIDVSARESRFTDDDQEIMQTIEQSFELLDELNQPIEKASKVKIIKQYGNEDINNLINYLQKRLNLPMLDGTIKGNRHYAHNIIRKYGGLKPVLELIDIVAEDDFWKNKITSIQDLYYKGIKILSGKRQTKGGIYDATNL